jgi:hypothetical protein
VRAARHRPPHVLQLEGARSGVCGGRAGR